VKASNSPAVIPAPTNEDKPFQVEDELTVYEAAMVYAGRHPWPKFFGPYDESNKRERCLTLLKLGLKERLPERRHAQRSWDVFRQLKGRIEQDQIKPIKPSYDLDGEIDPIRTVIKTTELIKLANERGEQQPEYLRHLQPENPAAHAWS
jgi:hypothetical protein